jgi:FKBP-type peptidyl-prolyl cis-trans isomerase
MMKTEKMISMKKGMLWLGSFLFLSSYFACQKDVLVSADEQIKRNNLVVSEYLRQNGITADSTASGLRYVAEVTNPQGLKPATGDTVFVNYEGRVIYGEVFDNSRFRNTPFSFPFNQRVVVTGFDEGIGLMRTGETFTLYLPAHLAYGTSSRGGIPANSNLIFKVELDSIKIRK